MKKKKSIFVAGLLLLVIVIGGLLAYFTDTDTATNIFTIGDDVDISLTEEDWENSPGTTIWTNLNAEDIFPGEEIENSPQINNESSTTPAYVFAEIIVPCYDSDLDSTSDTPLFTLNSIGTGWTLIDTSEVVTANKTITYVYAYGTNLAMTSLAPNTSTTPVYTSVTVDPDLTAEQAETLSDSPNIIINAYGIQTDSLSTSDPAEIFALF